MKNGNNLLPNCKISSKELIDKLPTEEEINIYLNVEESED